MYRAFNDRPAIFIAAIRLQGEEIRTDLIKITREGLHLADEVLARFQSLISVLVESHFNERHFAVFLGLNKGVHHFPELGLGLLNEAIHAITSVE